MQNKRLDRHLFASNEENFTKEEKRRPLHCPPQQLSGLSVCIKNASSNKKDQHDNRTVAVGNPSSRAYRTVRFAGEASVASTVVANHYFTVEESAAMWFSKNELIDIKASIFDGILDSTLKKGKAKKRRRWSMLGRTPQLTDATSSTNASMTTNVGSISVNDCCFRGLEHLVNKDFRQKRVAVRRSVLKSVLEEQQHQIQREEFDPVAIANASAQFSWRSRDVALKLGAEDASLVESIQIESDLASTMKGEQNIEEQSRRTTCSRSATTRRSSLPFSRGKDSSGERERTQQSFISRLRVTPLSVSGPN